MTFVKSILLAAAGMAALATGARAQLVNVVNFSSNGYVTANQPLVQSPVTTNTAGTWRSRVNFSETLPLSPAANYSGPTFYGGYELTQVGGAVAPTATLTLLNGDRLFGGKDAISVSRTMGANVPKSEALLILFKSADFMLPGSLFLIDSTSSFSLSESPFGASGRYVQRIVVQSGGSYFISRWSSNGFATTSTLSSASSDFGFWAAYDPTSALFFDASAATFSNVTLTDVTAVGFAYATDSLFNAPSGTISSPAFNLFSANLTRIAPVPESSSCAALGVIGLIAVIARRMKKTR